MTRKFKDLNPLSITYDNENYIYKIELVNFSDGYYIFNAYTSYNNNFEGQIIISENLENYIITIKIFPVANTEDVHSKIYVRLKEFLLCFKSLND